MSVTERSKAFGLADVDKRSLEKKSCYTLAVVHSWMTAGIVPKPVSKGYLLTVRSHFPKHSVYREGRS